ncbi:hypothetical protein C8R46DRAFT_1053905 [Mycena filopes]|nr:hypothetical protein C8R46DRAFT_1053905 [Mycena filopes]
MKPPGLYCYSRSVAPHAKEIHTKVQTVPGAKGLPSIKLGRLCVSFNFPTNMPSDSTPAVKRRVKTAAVEPQEDHRKRRRNRTTQSCLNCHATKRMCDRKRPCSRCIQLGLTGLCVYEVDDPARKSTTTQDETARLQNRIAELEGVIRELKNKPHPRWAADAPGSDNSFMQTPPTSPASSSSTSVSPLAHVNGTLSAFRDLGWTDLLNWESSGSSDSSYSRSPLSTPSPLLGSASRSPEFLPSGGRREPPWLGPAAACSCLSEPICYNTTVELASELRRASAVMSRSLNHSFGAPCALSMKICELETLAINALRDRRVCSSPTYRLTDMKPMQQQRKLAPLWDESGLPAFDDSFMAWIPPRL